MGSSRLRNEVNLWLPYSNARFRIFVDPEDVTLRAKLVLPSGETLDSLKIVDRQWRQFLANLINRLSKPPDRDGLQAFFNRSIHAELMRNSNRFARIGLARAKPREEKCWLMLDSLFPQPNASWLSGH